MVRMGHQRALTLAFLAAAGLATLAAQDRATGPVVPKGTSSIAGVSAARFSLGEGDKYSLKLVLK